MSVKLTITPETTLGPFYPETFMPLDSNEMTRMRFGQPQAKGEVVRVFGKVIDSNGIGRPRMLIEAWQTNAARAYRHPAEPNKDAHDPNFHGCGRVVTDDDGRYAVKTIKPGAYLAEPDTDWWHPSHLHFSIYGGGARLITQMLFPGDSMVQNDLIWLYVPDEAPRQRMIASTGAGDSDFVFDIVVRGPAHTPMEDEGVR